MATPAPSTRTRRGAPSWRSGLSTRWAMLGRGEVRADRTATLRARTPRRKWCASFASTRTAGTKGPWAGPTACSHRTLQTLHDFPTTPGAYETTFTGRESAFVAKLSPDGRRLVYATFLGGAGSRGTAIAVDSTGAAYVTSAVASRAFPITPDARCRHHGPGGV